MCEHPRRQTPNFPSDHAGKPDVAAAAAGVRLGNACVPTTVSTYLVAGRYPASETPKMKTRCPASLPPRLFLGLLLAPSLLTAADSIDSVEKAATEWVKVRAETVRVETEWASQRELLELTAKALAERAQAAEDKRDNLKAKTLTDRTELAAAQQKNQAAADRMQAVDARLKAMSDKLSQLRPSLPPRLSEALELPYRTLAGTDLGPAERMQVTMTVLNRCAQFNRLVTCGQEVLTIEGEPGPRSFEVVYWGLSRGYALDRGAGKVWLGSPGPKGWQWEPHPEAVRPVEQLIAVYSDKAEPEFVAVPAKLGHVASATSNP